MTDCLYRVCAGWLMVLVTAACLSVAVLGGCSPPSREDHSPVSQGRDDAAPMSQDRPPTERTLFSLAEILAAQGKDPQCEFVLQRCIQQYPRFMPAHNSLAELMMRQGRATEAVAVLSAALETHPQDPVLRNNLGMCLLVSRDYEETLRQFTQAAGLRPASRKYRANMAVALGLLGRYDEALALLRQVLPEEQAVHNVEVLRQVGREQ